MMKTKLRLILPLLFALCLSAASSHAASNPQITGWKTANDQLVVTIKDEMGSKQVIAESSGMDRMFSNLQAIIVGGGYAIIYRAPGTAKGGYENETEAVRHFNIYGTRTTLLNKPLRVNTIREVRNSKNYPLYAISMADGGAGIPHLYLVDKMKGEIWGKGAARMSGARNGKLIVAVYPAGEESAYPETKPIGTLYLDLDQMVDHMLGLDQPYPEGATS